MPSSFDAFHDHTRPLRLLEERPDPLPAPDRAFVGAVLAVLALILPVLVIAGL